MTLNPKVHEKRSCLDIFFRGCIVLYLSVTGLLTLFVTAYLPRYNYKIEFESSLATFVCTVAAIIVICLSLYLALALIVKRKPMIKAIEIAVFLYVFLASMVWAIAASVWMEWDPLSVLEAAKGIGDSSSVFFVPGQYIFRFPYQVPLVLVFKLYLSIFGESGIYEALELTIAISNSITILLIGRIAYTYTCDSKTQLLALLVGCLFLPLFFYTTFAYGNAIALPFCISAVYFQIKSIKERSIYKGLISSLLVLLGILLKSSYILFAVAMAAGWFSEFVKEKSVSIFILLCSLVAAYCAMNPIISFTARQIGVDPSLEMPKTAVLAMGLQETDPVDQPNNKGWYNGYLWSWDVDGYDVDVVKIESIDSIKKSLNRFFSNPEYAIDFFAKKYSSEWCEPTYESLLASNWTGESGRSGYGIMASRPMTKLLKSAYYGKIHLGILFLLDGLQSLIILFSLYFILRGREKCSRLFLVPGLFAAGSAVFYLFWEAQSQYIMPCYIMLIPYAASGLSVLFARFRDFRRTKLSPDLA